MEHSPTSATGTGGKRPAWHASRESVGPTVGRFEIGTLPSASAWGGRAPSRARDEGSLPAPIGCVGHVTPDQCRCLVPDGRPILPPLLTTARDIEDGSGSLVCLLVQDRIGRAGEDQQFSRRTRHTSSQNVHTAALLESPLSEGLLRG